MSVEIDERGGSFSLPWCPTCRRMRFGTACVECGFPLEIGEFVPRDVLDEALDLIEAEVEDDPRYQENDPIVEFLRRHRPARYGGMHG